MEQSGISFVADCCGRIYLRKNNAEGPLELCTDIKEFNKIISKKYTHYFITGITQFLLGMALLVQTLLMCGKRCSLFLFAVVVEVGLVFSAIIFFILSIKKKLDIPRLRAHLLRHTFATKYIENGGDIYSLQQILGHTTLEMTKKYAHITRQMCIKKFSDHSILDNFKQKNKG